MDKVRQCILLNDNPCRESKFNRFYTYVFINQCTTVFNMHQCVSNPFKFAIRQRYIALKANIFLPYFSHIVPHYH